MKTQIGTSSGAQGQACLPPACSFCTRPFHAPATLPSTMEPGRAVVHKARPPSLPLPCPHLPANPPSATGPGQAVVRKASTPKPTPSLTRHPTVCRKTQDLQWDTGPLATCRARASQPLSCPYCLETALCDASPSEPRIAVDLQLLLLPPEHWAVVD